MPAIMAIVTSPKGDTWDERWRAMTISSASIATGQAKPSDKARTKAGSWAEFAGLFQATRQAAQVNHPQWKIS